MVSENMELSWPRCVVVGCTVEASQWKSVGRDAIFFACDRHARAYESVVGTVFRPPPSPMVWPGGWELLKMRGKPCGLTRAGSTAEVLNAFD